MCRRALLALLLGLTSSCNCGSDPPDRVECTEREYLESTCANQIDDDCDGKTDGEDEDCQSGGVCEPPSGSPCGRQSDCGSILSELDTRVCLGGECRACGKCDCDTGEPISQEVQFDFALSPAYKTMPDGLKPRSLVVRVIRPGTYDGEPITCDLLSETISGRTEKERSKPEESDDQVQQCYRNLFPLNWSASTSAFQFMGRVPAVEGALVYAELWFGARSNMLPTGRRAATACKEGVSIVPNQPDPQRISLQLPAPQQGSE